MTQRLPIPPHPLERRHSAACVFHPKQQFYEQRIRDLKHQLAEMPSVATNR